MGARSRASPAPAAFAADPVARSSARRGPARAARAWAKLSGGTTHRHSRPVAPAPAQTADGVVPAGPCSGRADPR